MSPTTLPSAPRPPAEVRYDNTTILLHWLTAALVLLQWGIAHAIDWFPRGEARVLPRSVHLALGVLLALVMLARVVWRGSRRRRLATVDPGFAGFSARVVHLGLYAFVIATLVAGFWYEWLRGDSIFGLIRFSAADEGNVDLRRAVGGMHGSFANSLLIVSGLHATSALAHHYGFKDGVLRRMLPAKLFPDRR